MARILVTGGCGFIGSHVVDALVARGDSVCVVDNLSSGTRDYLPEGVEFIEGDIADASLIADAMQGCDGCVHLAAIASVPMCRDAWTDSHRTNVLGTTTIFDAAAKALPCVPVVYASSAATYGNNLNLPLSESDTPAPLTSYGMDKWVNERYADMARQTYGLASVGLRFFNVYGARQNPSSPYSGVISLFADAAKHNRPITLFGDGLQTRDFIHVSDIVALILSALGHASTKGGAEVVNGCTGKQASLLDLIAALNELHGITLDVTHAPARAGDIKHSLGNPEHANSLLGVTATTPLLEGLRDLS